METKICKRCGLEKPLSEFYVHKKMADGHLSFCKDCTKERVASHYAKRINDPIFVEKERVRGREKYRRLYADLHQASSHSENKNTRRDLESKGIKTDGKVVHRWNYNFKNDVFLLDARSHSKVHRELSYDKFTKCFLYKGQLLLSKDEHENAIKEILSVKTIEHYEI